jgi:2,3-dihydroxybenzoate decarboxylase
MFSVDWPFEEPGEACPWMDTVPIAEADRQKIGRDNAVSLFKLPT